MYGFVGGPHAQQHFRKDHDQNSANIVSRRHILGMKPSRDFIRDKLHGTDIPLSPLGIDWLSIQPRLGVGGDWGGVITFDLQDILNPPTKKK